MESFEHLCKVALEAENFVVTSNVKFFVRKRIRKAAYAEFQEHGYEVDLVGARADRLVLAEVKSLLGSRGVHRQSFRGLADEAKRTDFSGYKMLNDSDLRDAVVSQAIEMYGYDREHVEMRLYVGKFAGGHEESIRAHFAGFSRPVVRVVGLSEIVVSVMGAAERKAYRDDPVVMTVKALGAAGFLDRSSGESGDRN